MKKKDHLTQADIDAIDPQEARRSMEMLVWTIITFVCCLVAGICYAVWTWPVWP